MKQQIDTTDLREKKHAQFAKADLKRQKALICLDPPSSPEQISKSLLAGRTMQSEHTLLIEMARKFVRELENSRSVRNWKDNVSRIWNHILLYEKLMAPVDDLKDEDLSEQRLAGVLDATVRLSTQRIRRSNESS